MIAWRDIGSFLEKSVKPLFRTHGQMLQNRPVGIIRHENMYHCTKFQVSPASQSRQIRSVIEMSVRPFIQIRGKLYEIGHCEYHVSMELYLPFKFQVNTTSPSGVFMPL
jgi:hypothetical protein